MHAKAFIRGAYAVCVCGSLALGTSCGERYDSAGGADGTPAALVYDAAWPGDASITPRLLGPLPPLWRAGLRVEAALRASDHPWGRSLELDVRISNTEDEPKRYLGIEKISLGHQLTHFHPPPVMTLARRGSWVEYPGVASWEVREPPLKVMLPLYVLVRYEGRRGVGVVVPFQWDVWVDAVH